MIETATINEILALALSTHFSKSLVFSSISSSREFNPFSFSVNCRMYSALSSFRSSIRIFWLVLNLSIIIFSRRSSLFCVACVACRVLISSSRSFSGIFYLFDQLLRSKSKLIQQHQVNVFFSQ